MRIVFDVRLTVTSVGGESIDGMVIDRRIPQTLYDAVLCLMFSSSFNVFVVQLFEEEIKSRVEKLTARYRKKRLKKGRDGWTDGLMNGWMYGWMEKYYRNI